MAEMKNQKLLNKALNLLPDLVETKVDAVQTVELYKNDNSIVIEQAVDYRKRVLKKGSRVCLDFGNHQVGYLTLNLNYRGSHPDAPVWLKLHFAENATELFEDGKSYQGLDLFFLDRRGTAPCGCGSFPAAPAKEICVQVCDDRGSGY